MTKPTFGQRLKEARREANLTQAALAKRCGLSQAMVSELEGDRYDGTGQLVELAAALGVDAGWLKNGTGPKRPADAGGTVDLALLEDVLIAVDRASRGRDITPERRSRFAVALYQMAHKSGGKIDAATVAAFLGATL